MSADPSNAKPMGSAELDALREHLSTYPPGSWLKADRDDYVALLADRDGQERRACEVEDLYAVTLADHGREIREKGLAIARAEQAERERDEARAELANQREKATARVERLTDEWRVEMHRLQAEVTRLRARVRVEAEDLGAVTREHVEAWLAANGWETLTHEDDWLSFIAPNGPHVDVHLRDGWSSERVIGAVARLIKRPGLDILDEMAAMPTLEGPK